MNLNNLENFNLLSRLKQNHLNLSSSDQFSKTENPQNYHQNYLELNNLGAYQNQLNFEKNSINETNSTTNSMILKEKWWLNFFPKNHIDEKLELSEFLFRVFGVFICSILILTTLFGNTLTILVVLRFNRMKTVTNILLASLAVADITVALLVMPFLIISDYLRVWPFGAALCHFYISCDVMCCTASIQHLCAVAIDRYWAINKPLHYHRLMNKRRLVISIILIWLMSGLISFIPVFSGIYHEKNITASEIFLMTDYPNCFLQVNIIYAIFSSTISFYLPLPIMFYVYIRILLIAERQNREIKQLETHLRYNGVNCRNSAPAVHNVGNLDARSSTTNITTNSLPIDHHSARQLVSQPQIQPAQQLPQQQPILDIFLHGMPTCVTCHCNQMVQNTNINKPNETNKDLKNTKQENKELNDLPKDANKRKNSNDEPVDKKENSINEKTKLLPLNNKKENSIQKKSKYISKKFDDALINSLEEKENEYRTKDYPIARLTLNDPLKDSLKRKNLFSLTQSLSQPLVLDVENENLSQICKFKRNIRKNSNSNPNLDFNDLKTNLDENLDNEKKENKNKNEDSKKTDVSKKNEDEKEDDKKEELVKEQHQEDNFNRPLISNHCCCLNQYLIYCAHQLNSKMIQQNQQQNLNLQQTTISQSNFAQNLLNILAKNFPPIGERSAEYLDGCSSTSTSTANNLTGQQLAVSTTENQQNSQFFENTNTLAAIQHLTGINIQFHPPANFQQTSSNQQKNNQLNTLQHLNQFLQQNNLLCDLQNQQNQSAPNQKITKICPATSNTNQHQSCCSSNLINWTNRKCSDSSTVSGPIASCSSAASKSMCSTSTQCHFHYPHSINSLPIYQTNIPADSQATPIHHQANVQFDVNSLTGLHQARSNSNGSSVAVMDEIKRAERQLRKRSKQILTDTKAIRTLGIVMGVFCVCWLPFFIIYVVGAFWPNLPISYFWRSAVTWLGYLNSSLNPCIYALLNKEFKIAFKRVLYCHPRILVHNASANFNQSGQRRVGRSGAGGLNHSYTQSFSGSMNLVDGNNSSNTATNRKKGGFLSAVGHGIMREFSSSGTFHDMMEYSFGKDSACLINLSGDASKQQPNNFLNRNQGIRISFDFTAENDLNLDLNSPISNCSTRQPSIASGYEIPTIISATVNQKSSSHSTDNKRLSPHDIQKVNKETYLTVQRPTGHSVSSEDLIYVNTTDISGSGVSSGGSTLSAPNESLNKAAFEHLAAFRNKLKLNKQKKKKFKAELQSKMMFKRNENLDSENAKDRTFLSVKDNLPRKSNPYLNILRRKSTEKKRSKIDQNEQNDRN